MNFLKKRPKHLLIDLDGTLLGNRSLAVTLDFVRMTTAELKKNLGVRQALQAIFAVHQEFKRPSSPEPNDVRAMKCIMKHTGWSKPQAEKHFGGSVEKTFLKLEKHFFTIPAAQSFIQWAKDKFELTLATNPVWPRPLVDLRLKWAGIEPQTFSLITSIERMHASKPSSHYYQEVLSLLGCKAQECLMIGNDRKMDLPATQCGIPVYLIEGSRRLSQPFIQLIKTKGSIPAWSGSFPALQKLLQALDSAS